MQASVECSGFAGSVGTGDQNQPAGALQHRTDFGLLTREQPQAVQRPHGHVVFQHSDGQVFAVQRRQGIDAQVDPAAVAFVNPAAVLRVPTFGQRECRP